jgi:endonuclease YncB( thermonuclease family)
MPSRFPRLAFARRRRRHEAPPEVLALASVGAVAIIGVWAFDVPAMLGQLALTKAEIFAMSAVAAAVVVAGASIPTGYAFFLWHAFAAFFAETAPHPLQKPWVVDGDTIDDRATGVRYRLTNIDAPETGDNAKCFRERTRGEEATQAAIELVRAAKVVSVRRTFRHDIYGRRVAFVLIDGQDLGALLMAQGLARPWRGKRRKWCGPRGGLALIARTGARAHACKTCSAFQPNQGGAGNSR